MADSDTYLALAHIETVLVSFVVIALFARRLPTFYNQHFGLCFAIKMNPIITSIAKNQKLALHKVFKNICNVIRQTHERHSISL